MAGGNGDMGTRTFEFAFLAVFTFFEVVTPLVMVWGWIRWARHEKRWTILAILSFIGFVLASASAALAVSSFIYGNIIGGWPYYDPRLIRIFACGALLSALALLSSFAGVWRRNTLRWYALFCSFGTLVFWIATAGME
jgi:hypothetical protein